MKTGNWEFLQLVQVRANTLPGNKECALINSMVTLIEENQGLKCSWEFQELPWLVGTKFFGWQSPRLKGCLIGWIEF